VAPTRGERANHDDARQRAADDEAHERATDDEVYERGRPKLRTRDSWRLVFATYRVSLPYLLVFVLGMLVATWLVTTVLFR
jgi:hypothetical protein